MYRLYGNIAGCKELDRSNDEKNIIDTMEEYVSRKSTISFFIIEQLENCNIPYKSIQSEKEYNEYREEYANKVKKLTKRR